MLSLSRQPCTAAWLQCVAGLQFLHNNAAAGAAAAGCGLLPAWQVQHQQHAHHHPAGCRCLFTLQQHDQSEQTPPAARQQWQQQQQSDADSVSGVRSLIHKQRLQLPRAAIPSLEQELQQLRERQEQHLLQAVAHQQRRPQQRHTHDRNSSSTHARQQDEQVVQQRVSGLDINPFSQLGVAKTLVRSLSEAGIHTPTPVQVDTFPAVMSGRNCSVQSPAGTGKTLAYLLPLVTRLQPWLTERRYRAKAPRVLVLCPTQELCVQVLRTARQLLPLGQTYAQPLVGGSSITKSAEALKRHGPVLLTATPGRLLTLLSRRPVLLKPKVRPSDDGTDTRGLSVALVLEEVDRLCAMDDFKELLPWLDGKARGSHLESTPLPSLAQHMRSILNAYQVILVSASLRPNSLQTATAWADTDPINVCSEAPADATPAARAAAAAAEAGQGAAKQTAWGQMLPDTISHQVLVYETLEPSKRRQFQQRLLQLFVSEGQKVLIFCKQGLPPHSVAKHLIAVMGPSYKVAALYGDQPGHTRARVLSQFNQGELHALATSDAFGLGLDYKEVDVVLCLDEAAPTAQAYVARAGRTGRMGRPGTVLTLLPARKLHSFKQQAKRVTNSLLEMKLRADESGRYVLGVKRQLVQQPGEGKSSAQHENSSS